VAVAREGVDRVGFEGGLPLPQQAGLDAQAAGGGDERPSLLGDQFDARDLELTGVGLARFGHFGPPFKSLRS
jgi:hypothetical protein